MQTETMSLYTLIRIYMYVLGYYSKPMILHKSFLNKISYLQKLISATGLPLKSSGGSFCIEMTIQYFAHLAK